MEKKVKAVPADKLSFEAALEELEDISNKMSQGALPLEESVNLYARGVELTKRCRQLLDTAERKIQVLDGELTALNEKSLRANSNSNQGAGESGNDDIIF